MLDRSFQFTKGSHPTREDGMCLNEAAAYLAGEEHTDDPACADHVILHLSAWLNDNCDDVQRQELCGDLPWRIVGTKSTPEIEQQRAFMAAEWAMKFVCGTLLRRGGADHYARGLQALSIADARSAMEASLTVAPLGRSYSIVGGACGYTAAALAFAAHNPANCAAHVTMAASESVRCVLYQPPVVKSLRDLIVRMIGLTELKEMAIEPVGLVS